jgi:hypothetical protein
MGKNEEDVGKLFSFLMVLMKHGLTGIEILGNKFV